MQRAKCKFVTIDKCENNVDEGVVYVDGKQAIEIAGLETKRESTHNSRNNNKNRIDWVKSELKLNGYELKPVQTPCEKKEMRNYSFVVFFFLFSFFASLQLIQSVNVCKFKKINEFLIRIQNISW